jgi:hypothetical protein
MQPGTDKTPPRRKCVCGHQREVHEHYRRGTDCALCSCRPYRSWLSLGRVFGRSQPNPTNVSSSFPPSLLTAVMRPCQQFGRDVLVHWTCTGPERKAPVQRQSSAGSTTHREQAQATTCPG